MGRWGQMGAAADWSGVRLGKPGPHPDPWRPRAVPGWKVPRVPGTGDISGLWARGSERGGGGMGWGNSRAPTVGGAHWPEHTMGPSWAAAALQQFNGASECQPGAQPGPTGSWERVYDLGITMGRGSDTARDDSYLQVIPKPRRRLRAYSYCSVGWDRGFLVLSGLPCYSGPVGLLSRIWGAQDGRQRRGTDGAGRRRTTAADADHRPAERTYCSYGAKSSNI